MPEFARRNAVARPDEAALTDPSRSIGWADLDVMLNQVANAVRAADLGPNHRVAVFAENAAETALAHLGGLLGGASTVPVNFHLIADEAGYVMRDSTARILFVGPETVERGLAAVDGSEVHTIVGWGLPPTPGVVPWEDWLAAADPSDPPMSTAPRPNLLYTSGTTGLPKGTELPPTMFAGGGTMTEHLEALQRNAFAAFGTHLVVGPMYHTGPLSGMRLLVAGIPSVILGRFDAEATLQTIETHRTESAVMVPTHFVRLLALPDDVKQRYDVSSMKLVAHTGAPCPVDVKRAMIEWWGPIFNDAYGATEVGTTCSINSVDWLAHPGSVGRSIPPFEALVLDDDGNEVPVGTEGRLYFRDTTGRGVVYPNDPEKTAAAHIAPGVFTLGEIAYLDQDGFVFLTDRFSDMVVSGGANIYPAEAEQVLINHPQVADVACIGVPHADMGEELIALVIPTDPADPPTSAELIAWCRERLSHYKCPRRVEIVDDLGRNTMGKLNKRALRGSHGVMDDRWITDWTPSARFPHYTRANSGEVLPTPASPLGQQFTWERGICFGWRDGYVRVGTYAADEFDPVHPETIGFFGGYMYINLANVRMLGVRSPAVTVEQLDLAFFGDHPDVPPYVAHPDDERPDLVPGIVEHLGWVMSTTEWPEIDCERDETIAFRTARPDLAALDDDELLARARSTLPMLHKLFESHTVTSSSSAIAPGILAAIGAAIGDPTIPMKLVAGIGHVDSAEPSYQMWDLSRIVRRSSALSEIFDAGHDGLLERLRSSDASTELLAGFDQLIADHGCRGPNEWEISAETWETHPEIALAAIDRIRLQSDDESPEHRNHHVATEREALTLEVRAKVAPLGDELTGQYEAALVAAHQLAFRERTKTNIIRVVHEGRMVFRELGRRHHRAGHLDDPAHVFMLLDAELESFVADPASFRATLAERATTWHELWDLVPPYFIKDGAVPPLGEWARRGESHERPAEVGEVFHGVSGCPGKVTGRARIVTDPAEPGDLEPADILVAPLTDPAWTPLFMAVGGVVVDVGGQISHAIIVSRELGLPCVVSATGASARIPDGALIEVDADHGTVTVLEAP